MKNSILSGETSLISYLCAQSASALESLNVDAILERHTAKLMADYWISVRDAHKNGKKLVCFGGSLPSELLYAADCVPFYLDLLPMQIATDANVATDLINEAEVRINQSICSLNKTMLGALLAKSHGFKPDAFVYAQVKCPSSGGSLERAGLLLGVPCFRFDIPTRKNDRSIEYLEPQIHKLMDFLRELTGKPVDFEQLQLRAAWADKSGELMEKCVKLRCAVPCPMSSRVTALSGLMSAMAPTQEMCELVQAELELVSGLAATKKSVCPRGERHRVYLLQCLKSGNDEIIRWMEEKYDAPTVMEGFRYGVTIAYGRVSSFEEMLPTLCRKLMSPVPLHDSAEFAETILENVGRVFRDFSVDVPIILGNVGCRHTWAITKMLSDYVQDSFGLGTLFVDVNNIDLRHKPLGEIQELIGEYMDTVIEPKRKNL